MNTIAEPGRNLPVSSEVDVLVVGGGPSGIIAALAAAEEGMRVTLLEQRSFVGGNLVLGLPVLGFLSQKGEPVIAGLPQKFINRLKAVNAAGEHQACPLHMSLTLVEPDAVRLVALEMLREAGVEVALYSPCTGVVMDGNSLRGVVIESKSGCEAVLARVIIDCTGDADIAFRAGVPCGKGDEKGGMQPPTLMFAMAGADTEKLRMSLYREPETCAVDRIPPEYFGRNRRFIAVGLRRQIQEARQAGLSITTERTILITGLREGEVWVNMTRVKGIDGTSRQSLSAGEMEAARQIADIVQYLRIYVPGFEKAYVSRIAPFLGIRETRRIAGHYVMTRDDILKCRRFEDAVAVASYPIDLHRPDDDDCTLEWCGDCYDIPYRSLLPQRTDNLLVAGRCISTTHEAMAAIRVMSTCMAMGEAAGRAAAIAVNDGIPPSEISIPGLRRKLTEAGVFLRG